MRLSLARFTVAISLATLCSVAAPRRSRRARRPRRPTQPSSPKRRSTWQRARPSTTIPAAYKCEEAIREFGKAYELSGSLNALKGQAVCNLELERDGEAIEQYTKYLQAKGSAIDAADKNQVETDLNTLRASAAFITFSTDHAGVKITDVRTPSKGFPITNRYPLPMTGRKIRIHPGQHTFTASAEGVPDQTWTMEIVNGSKLEHTFEFDKGKPVVVEGDRIERHDEPKMVKTRPVPTSAFVMGGVTVALAVPLAIFGVRALGKERLQGRQRARAPGRARRDGLRRQEREPCHRHLPRRHRGERGRDDDPGDRAADEDGAGGQGERPQDRALPRAPDGLSRRRRRAPRGGLLTTAPIADSGDHAHASIATSCSLAVAAKKSRDPGSLGWIIGAEAFWISTREPS